MSRIVSAALLVALSSTSLAVGQGMPGEVLDVQIAIAQRTGPDDEVYRIEAHFLSVSGMKAVWSREGRPVGARIGCIASAGDDGATVLLEIEVRQPVGDQESTERLELAAKVPYGEPVEVASVRSPEPDAGTWVVRVACQRAGGPRAPPPAAPAEVESGDRSIRLQGVMVEGEGPARAILSVSGQILEVEVGDLVPGDWQVAAVDAGGITLRGAGGVTRRLSVR